MKKTVITVIRVIVIVGVLGLLTYGGFLGMNRVSGNGDYNIDAYAATDDGGQLTVTKAGTVIHVDCSAEQLAAVAAEKKRLQIAPPLALQGCVDLRFGPPLGKRRHAQVVGKRPPRFTLKGRLQRLRYARDRRSPHVERAQYGVQEFAEHGRLRSFAQSSGV